MRRIDRTGTIIVMIFILSISGTVTAEAGPQDAEKDPGRRHSVFETEDETELDLRSLRVDETLKLSGDKLDSPSVSVGDMNRLRKGYYQAPGSVYGKKKIALSVMASALLPGLGEFCLYIGQGNRSDWSTLSRVPLFIGMDAFLWYKHKINYDEGKERKEDYEEFCDAHWSEERFLLQHPFCENIGGCDDWQTYNEEASGDLYYFIYTPKELDREEFYENCGKYDAFVFGWDDWDPEGWDYTYENFDPWTPHRTIYWELREESDKFIVRADQYMMMLILNRVVSMVDVLWIAHQMNNDSSDDGGWSLDIMPDNVRPAVGISYRF